MEDWTDLWEVRWEVGLKGTVPFPKGNPLPSLDRLDDYRFPSPDDLVFTEKMAATLKQVDRSEQLVIRSLFYMLFDRAWAIMGMNEFMTALMTHPEEMHEFLHGIAHFARGVTDRYLELDVDGVSFLDDLGPHPAHATAVRNTRKSWNLSNRRPMVLRPCVRHAPSARRFPAGSIPSTTSLGSPIGGQLL